MGVIQECKPILAEKNRRDLLRFVREEIADLNQDEAVEITAELVVDNLISKHPENTYVRPPKKHEITEFKKNEKQFVGKHQLKM